MPCNTKFPVLLYIAALAVAVSSPRRVLAGNDWLVPCMQGQCSWDLPAHSGASGTLHIVLGPHHCDLGHNPRRRMADHACDPDATAQDIRLECPDGNPACDHLFQGGAVDTIVRLPDGCGPMPFARVARHWTNTSGSPAVTARASDAQVHSLALDTNFAAAAPPSNGSVSFTVQGLNVKGSNGAFTVTTPAAVHRRRSFDRRRLNSSPHHLYRRGNFIEDALQALQNATSFNKTMSQNLQPVNFSGAANLFNTSFNCPASSAISASSSASLSLDVDADVHATVSLGAVAAGTIIPPNLSEFGLTLGLDGNIDTLFSLTANLTGHVSSGSISLFQIGIPGLSFPGILEVGPEFKLTGNVDADLTLANVNASVRLAYNLSEVLINFPPQKHFSTSGSFKQGVSEVSVSAGNNITDVGASVNVTGHLIPQVDIGLSALGGIVSTSVFLNLDASAGLHLSANADVVDGGNNAAAPAGDLQACVDANAGLAVNIGAQAAFFDLFNASTGATLFDKSFPLLQKCVGYSNSTSASSTHLVARRDYALRAAPKFYLPSTKRQGLGCPLALATQVSQIVNAIIPVT